MKSRDKHGVSQAEAEQVILRGPLVLAPDTRHSDTGARFLALGETAMGRLLLAVFTVRGDRIRIISTRDMSRRERQVYEEARRHSPPVSK